LDYYTVSKRESIEALYRTPQYLTYEQILIGDVQVIVVGNSKVNLCLEMYDDRQNK
jgi:hypothetical protein